MSNVGLNLTQLNKTGQQIVDTADSALGYQVTRDVISSVRYVCEKSDVIYLTKNCLSYFFSPYINFLHGFVSPPDTKSNQTGYVVPPVAPPVTHPVTHPVEQSNPGESNQSGSNQKGSDQKGSDQNGSVKVTIKTNGTDSKKSTPPSSSQQTLDQRFKKLAQITDKLLNEAATKHGIMETPEKTQESTSVSKSPSPNMKSPETRASGTRASGTRASSVSKSPSPNTKQSHVEGDPAAETNDN